MRIRIITAAAGAALTATLTGCTITAEPSVRPAETSTPKATEPAESKGVTSDALKDVGIPPKPTGADRQELLDGLAAVNPGIVRYEDKAIDSARNQCQSLNDTGVQRIDWLASQRFTYKDVATSESQGKAINELLTDSGFCKV